MPPGSTSRRSDTASSLRKVPIGQSAWRQRRAPPHSCPLELRPDVTYVAHVPDDDVTEAVDWELRVELYRAARETRAFEIRMFWQRSNYFLVLNTALAVGFFSLGPSDVYALALSVVGVAVASLWVRINLGSKYWQSRWEERLRVVENDLHEGLDLFSAGWKVLDGDVARSLGHARGSGWLKRLHDKLVLEKPSVSKTMMSLSVLFVVLWCLAAIASTATIAIG